MSLKVRAMRSKRAKSGDFGAVVTEQALLLPVEIVSAFASHGVDTAEGIVSFLQSYPSSIASDLKWRVPEVEAGFAGLRRQLKGVVADVVLDPPRFGMPFGARNPVEYEP